RNSRIFLLSGMGSIDHRAFRSGADALPSGRPSFFRGSEFISVEAGLFSGRRPRARTEDPPSRALSAVEGPVAMQTRATKRRQGGALVIPTTHDVHRRCDLGAAVVDAQFAAVAA